MNKQNKFSILFLPQPKKAKTSLHNWNLLVVEQLFKQLQSAETTLVIYTSGSEEDIENVSSYAKHYFANVLVYTNLGKTSIKASEYTDIVSKTLTNFVDEGNTTIENIFWTMSTIHAGFETIQSNHEETLRIVKEHINDEEFSTGLEFMLYQTLINYFLSFNIPMIHQLIIDPVEVDVSIFVDSILHYNIRRHFVHPLMNRQNVQVNPFIVKPFFIEDSEFFNNPMSVEKTKSFVFGMTAYDDIRREFLEDFRKLAESSENIQLYFCYIDKTGTKHDNRLSYEDYIKAIASSKTTMVIPSYDQATFSVHRFVEAVSVGCLPIVFSAMHEVGFAGFTDTNEFIAKHLYIDDLTELQQTIDRLEINHQQLLNDLLQTSYFKYLKKQTSESSLIYYNKI
jgi:hypothetical protein